MEKRMTQVLVMMTYISVCFAGCASGRQEFISCIAQDTESAEDYFASEQWEIIVQVEGDSTVLMIQTIDGRTYKFARTLNGDELTEISQEIVKDDNGVPDTGNLVIRRRDDDIVSVEVDYTGTIGVVGVKYELPDFELVNDWGDPGEAELKIFKWKSIEEIKECYQEGKQVEQQLAEYARSWAETPGTEGEDNANILKEKSGVGVGFVDGDIEILYQK